MAKLKIFKFSGYAITEDQNMGRLDIFGAIRDKFHTQHFHVEQSESDDEELYTESSVDLAMCEKCFSSKPSSKFDREIEVGATYRHFKGKLVKVLAVSQDTENPGSFSVVYLCMDGDNKGKVWHRPYDMFLSPTDKNKYPEVEQKYRFEKVE